jgi:L,D-transpeptidase ErfK/SrfK
VVPAGPDNPLGQYMFRLSWPSYLIHGTNKPYGVGMRSSHGCMRLYPEDIAVFFDLIPIGTKVTVVNQPYLFGWRDGTLYLQAYAVMEDDSRDWSKNRKRCSRIC